MSSAPSPRLGLPACKLPSRALEAGCLLPSSGTLGQETPGEATPANGSRGRCPQRPSGRGFSGVSRGASRAQQLSGCSCCFLLSTSRPLALLLRWNCSPSASGPGLMGSWELVLGRSCMEPHRFHNPAVRMAEMGFFRLENQPEICRRLNSALQAPGACSSFAKPHVGGSWASMQSPSPSNGCVGTPF